MHCVWLSAIITKQSLFRNRHITNYNLKSIHKLTGENSDDLKMIFAHAN